MMFSMPKVAVQSAKVKTAVWVLGLLGVAFSFYATSVGFHNSIYDFHGFRQAQTAISANSIAHGGSFLSYETPVFGPPWSIPFEFPLYQGMVAGLTRTFSTHLDQTGRVVSILFYYLCFLPLASILSRLGLRGWQMIPTLTLFAASPLYIFVSRLFMIESTALFLALMYGDQMLGLVRAGVRWQTRHIAGAAVAGVLAGLVKVTTFAPYFVMGTCLVAWTIWSDRREWKQKSSKIGAATLFCLVVPVVATWSWTRFADHVKERNPMGVYLTSKALNAWTFGPLAQRFHPRVYLQLFRAANNQVGSTWIYVIVFVLCSWLIGRLNRIALACVFLYIGTILLFFNLHVVHEYYPYSNAIFLVIAMGVLIAAVLKKPGPQSWIGILLLGLELSTCASRYLTHYYPIQRANAPGRPAAAALIDEKTSPEAVILILGLEWSPEFPYQSNRRAIMLTDLGRKPARWSTKPVEEAIANQGVQNVAAFIVCDSSRKDPLVLILLRDAGMDHPASQTADNCDIYQRNSEVLSSPQTP